MIKKIEHEYGDPILRHLAEKINELIDWCNEVDSELFEGVHAEKGTGTHGIYLPPKGIE